MHVISPAGTVHHLPLARHARPNVDHSLVELFTDSTCTELVAALPGTWAILTVAPQKTAVDEMNALQLEKMYAKRNIFNPWEAGTAPRTFRLFGRIPLFTIR